MDIRHIFELQLASIEPKIHVKNGSYTLGPTLKWVQSVLARELGIHTNGQMKDSSVLALIFAVYAALAIIFYAATTVNLGMPFLIPLMIDFFYSFVSAGSSLLIAVSMTLANT